MLRSRRFFYLLIFLAIVAALFFSTLAGLIILGGAIIYYFVLGRQTGVFGRASSTIPASEPAELETVPNQIACKRCGTLFDPTGNTSCPSCGAPIES